ncbi:glucans biosynthesis glucosyltransferase H-like [Haliotis rufescens]|uniref:glucans biosynthesis glucosyltransferase H-like n=1 Tax=Haliotis rufescens TaxID=6454 RepID=UPI001EAFB59B|nr:glucans biosynthesis glucosyltransferase H-like [Haliotis rufescens]
MNRTKRVFVYFTFWVVLALGAVLLNIFNIDWSKTNIFQGILLTVVLGVLQGSVLEFPVMTVATLLVGGDRRENDRVSGDQFTIVLNYNLLAVSKDDIDECLQTMYDAYMGNLSENACAVLVSATNSEELKTYELEVRDNFRAMVYDELFREGLNYASGDRDLVDSLRLQHIWSKFDDMDRNIFVRTYLDEICDRFARDFMVVHRVSRVLRKCGQYQDLMLLSHGDDEAYTYTDKDFYGRQARPFGQPLFHDSEDVENIFGRQFDYTLVLDGDTGVVRGSVFQLLEIAAANPDRGIIQPAIKLHCTSTDTIFMHLERMRQAIYEPMTNAITALLGQSSYFGKALIRNSVYIENVIGTRDNLIERVPVDVLSHDTFEAALLKPLYAGSVYLLEAPSYNYVAWNIRERRWNRGEVLLSMYFWKNAIGIPMRWLQKKLQGEKFNATKLRTESKLDFVTSYIAHSALRQMFMKPLLLAYIIIHYQTHLRYRYASIIIVMFLVLVFPKFATCTRENYKFVFLETVASILQFTPEAMVGCVRIVRAIQANISASVKWVPQRAVEEEFKNSNPFISSCKHLWGYNLFAVTCAVLVGFFASEALLILVMLVTLFFLPFYTGFTSLTPDFKSSKSVMEKYKANVETAISTIAQPDKRVGPQKYVFTNIATTLSTHPDANTRYKPFAFRGHYNVV